MKPYVYVIGLPLGAVRRTTWGGAVVRWVRCSGAMGACSGAMGAVQWCDGCGAVVRWVRCSGAMGAARGAMGACSGAMGACSGAMGAGAIYGEVQVQCWKRMEEVQCNARTRYSQRVPVASGRATFLQHKRSYFVVILLFHSFSKGLCV